MSFYKMAQGMMVDEKSYIDCLFFQSDIYRYRLDYEYCILSFYNNIKNIDEKMISIMNQTKKYHKSLLKNLKYYIHFLPVKKKKKFYRNHSKRN